MSTLFLLKLAAMPAVIVTATLAGRRFGAGVAGLILGLPIVSGPISVFIVIEQGVDFARTAASGTVLGLIALASYAFTYAHAARRLPWPVALGCSWCVTAAMVWLLSSLPIADEHAIWYTAGAIALAILFCPKPGAAVKRGPPPWWDLPARMIVSTTFMLTVTLLAQGIGPSMAGMASTFPVMTSVMAPFTQRVEGRAAVIAMMRGCIEGLVTFALFFQVLLLTLGRWPTVWAYLAALAASLALAGIVLMLQRRRIDTRQGQPQNP